MSATIIRLPVAEKSKVFSSTVTEGLTKDKLPEIRRLALLGRLAHMTTSYLRIYQGPKSERVRRTQKENQINPPQIETDIAETQAQTETKPHVETPAKEIRKPKSHYGLIVLSYSLAAIGLAINGYFSYSRGTNELDKSLFAALGFVTESAMFFIPAQAAVLWSARKWGSFTIACLVYPLLFLFAVSNSLGFASVNLSDVATARAERVSPDVQDAQRRIAILSQSREQECRKRGDKCRALEAEEREALDGLQRARAGVRAESDPQLAGAQKLLGWASAGRLAPTETDMAMFRLFLLTLLPQLGGGLLLLARR